MHWVDLGHGLICRESGKHCRHSPANPGTDPSTHPPPHSASSRGALSTSSRRTPEVNFLVQKFLHRTPPYCRSGFFPKVNSRTVPSPLALFRGFFPLSYLSDRPDPTSVFQGLFPLSCLSSRPDFTLNLPEITPICGYYPRACQ